MIKKMTRIIFFVLALSICLNGCSKEGINSSSKTSGTANNSSEIQREISTDKESATNSVTKNDRQHLSMDMGDHLTVDADVVCPSDSQYASYQVEPSKVDPKTSVRLFCPDDDSNYVLSDVEGYASPDNYQLVTESGNEILVYGNAIYYRPNGFNKYLEIMDLLIRYKSIHPEEATNSLDSVSLEEAETLGKKVIAGIGTSFEPVLQNSIAMNHEQIIAWQQELLSDPDYAAWVEVGKTIVLSQLTSEDDACYLSFGLTYNGLPVYGKDEPSISFADNVFPPRPAVVEMIVTSKGIQYFAMHNAYTIVAEQNVSPIDTIDDALVQLKEKYDLVILTDNQKVSSAWLEYIPVKSGNNTILTPYWCLVIDVEMNDQYGKPLWIENALAERFNAFTGEDMTYGG